MSANLAWGCPVVVREALIKTIGSNFLPSSPDLGSMGYPPHFGTEKLITQLKFMAERQSGVNPKHLFVTCGATGAINAAIYALKTSRTDWIVTDNRYYPMYPKIVNLTDMIMVDSLKKTALVREGCSEPNFISLSASPSNPEGLVCPFESLDIWDAAYASRVYTEGNSHIPERWRIMCGSVGKSLGLAGLRLGWVSTNEDLLANSLQNYILASYVGLSSSSMQIAEDILGGTNLDKFEVLASNYINDNREEVQKLLTKFGQGSVPVRGMFTVLELGKAESKALLKAKIKWQPGSSWGEHDGWARLSLGQNREITRKAVRAALK